MGMGWAEPRCACFLARSVILCAELTSELDKSMRVHIQHDATQHAAYIYLVESGLNLKFGQTPSGRSDRCMSAIGPPDKNGVLLLARGPGDSRAATEESPHSSGVQRISFIAAAIAAIGQKRLFMP